MRHSPLARHVREGLRQLFSLPEDYEVILGVGGSTAFWDVATYGLIEQRSQHLVFGEFTSKFAQAAQAAPWLADPQVISCDPGARVEAVIDAVEELERRPRQAGDDALGVEDLVPIPERDRGLADGKGEDAVVVEEG